MGSVRARISATAVVVTAIALVVAAVVLLQGLRSSLAAEVDDRVSDLSWDYSENLFNVGFIDENLAIPTDEATLLTIFDDQGELYLANDLGVDVAEIVSEIPFRDSLESLEPIVVDASIDTATDTPGSESMRAAVFSVFFEDQTEDEPQLYVLVAQATDSIDETVASMRNRLLVVFPIVLLIVGVLAWWLTGRSLRPVEVMRREVDEISAGDLSRRVSTTGGSDEIEDLAVTMNGMLGRMEQSTSKQRQFVSDAAHELRTPLASIAAQLDVDAAHPDTADHGRTAWAVRGEVTRMQQMIDSMLHLARSDQGQETKGDRLLDLDEIARSTASRVPKPDYVDLDVSRIAPVEIRGDEQALLRLADNLLANAYRHAVSRVVVSVGSDTAGVWLTVDDDGSGVAPENREAVFERFVRLDEARSRDAGGSGLGLALSRDIAEGHGGELFVVDGSLGGAQFVLRLPANAR